MKRFLVLSAISLTAAACGPGAAQAAFGVNNFDVTFTNPDGTPAKAGSHPFAMTTSLGANFNNETLIPEGWLKDLFFKQVPGLVADTTAYQRCASLEFLETGSGSHAGIPACSPDTQVGLAAVSATEAGLWEQEPVFNLKPPPGVLLRLGFRVLTENIYADVTVNQSPPYNGLASVRNTPQLVNVFGNVTQLWGNPTDPRHDDLRGLCGRQNSTLLPGDIADFQFLSAGGDCHHEVLANPKPLLTMPTNCSEPLTSRIEVFSWEGEFDAESSQTHDASGTPAALSGCDKLDFHPSIGAEPTTLAAQSPTGLDVSLDVKDEGLTNSSEEARAQSDIKKVVFTLPKGMTANPSIAEGLEVCSEEDLARETLGSAPGAGCPKAAKIGTVEVESPLTSDVIKGALYQAKPHENLAGDSLLAVYLVLKNANLGIILKQAVKVEPDPRTGQLITTTEDIPQLPFSHFRLHFREGGRSPLVSPPLCGSYEAKAEMTPWSGGAPFISTSTFQILSGPNEGPCPAGETPPFDPGFKAGSENNAAGAYSPFSMRLTRRDGDQDLTRFDTTLPPGVLGKLAGIDKCPEAQIAQTKTKTGIAELQSPSCPANSKIGSIEAGAGVGSQLTYVPGSLYLAGPFGGAPLSVLGVVPAVAGPFDIGTVLTRFALNVDPRTAEVSVDGAHSDPIPHILEGIPLVVRDIQAHVDRANFTINPTSCDPFATKAAIWGGGADPFSLADDSPVPREARYQASNCSRLGFKPGLSLKLKGGIHRGDNPALHAVLKPRSGDANIEATIVRLPRSAFLDQSHFKTICTRVQYAAKSCPKGSIYGHVRAFTPLLSEPLEGPAYLRSSNHNLPDLVFSLHGLVDFEAVARIDSKNGGIRASFTGVPDAPISKVVVDMQGASKGLIVNSTNLCGQKHRANVRLDAHNAKRLTIEPVMQARCSKRK
jgi:hypothetical protein